MSVVLYLFCECVGDHRDQHVRTHSYPTRRSSDLSTTVGSYSRAPAACCRAHSTTTYSRTPRSRGYSGLGAVTRNSCNAALKASSLVFERSEEHTSELQSLMRISYAVFCLKKKKHTIHI